MGGGAIQSDWGPMPQVCMLLSYKDSELIIQNPAEIKGVPGQLMDTPRTAMIVYFSCLIMTAHVRV